MRRRHVAGIELRPGNPQVVQHLLLFIDTTGSARRLLKEAQENEKKNPALDLHTGKPLKYSRGAGYTRGMAIGLPSEGVHGWRAGNPPRFLPDGVGMLLPKNADLVVHAHYG